MAVTCIVSEIKRDIGQNRDFSYPFYIANPRGKLLRKFSRCFFTHEPDPCLSRGVLWIDSAKLPLFTHTSQA